ncbi:hypothetical protein GALMADRAFT_921125 [Galerina marginata CBS 339.88]|uniref:Secreted protein n=1 Tax=Galerina marginata (strain CBS 339.88) TaxID=685588 RepID=A0A067SP67_GALM3|nr:hypothetical protein GALMADRAFT_921125 [Galerina marginata CBS 339.88]
MLTFLELLCVFLVLVPRSLVNISTSRIKSLAFRVFDSPSPWFLSFILVHHSHFCSAGLRNPSSNSTGRVQYRQPPPLVI